MNNFDYKNMTPFKWFVLENFPYIENDFESINNYRLFSKVVECLNKTIDNVNVLGNLVEQFSDYFDNLDVQEEVNNKLDEMATDGTLENIINQEILGEINNRLDFIENEQTLFIGDSYAEGYSPDGNTTSWASLLKTRMNLNNNSKIIYEGGAGFLHAGLYNHTFLQLLQSKINENLLGNLNNYKNIIVCGGYNDKETSYSFTNLQTAINTFVTFCNTNFPNAKVYIGSIGYTKAISTNGDTYRNNINLNVTRAYNNNNALPLINVNNVMKNNSYFASDNIHPNQNGQNAICNAIYNALYKNFELLTSTSFLSVSFNTGITMNGGLSNYRRNNLNIIWLADLRFNFSPHYLYKASTAKIDIGTYNLNYLLPFNNYVSLPVECLISVENDVYINTIGQLEFSKDGHLYLDLQLIDPSTNKTYNNINIRNVTMKSTSYTIET